MNRFMRSFLPVAVLTMGLILAGCDKYAPQEPVTNEETELDFGALAKVKAFASGTWSPTGNMAIARARHTATLLRDGRVLVTGGLVAAGNTPTCEIYDPSSGAWSSVASMLTPRSLHTATLLPDGKVLIAGGRFRGSSLATAELFDPATGTWSPTGSMEIPRDNHVATLLSDGRVLVTGGVSGDDSGSPVEKSAEIYDPLTGSWVTTDHMAVARYLHQATLLMDGRVLVTGGFNPSAFHVPVRNVEIFDPQTNHWSNATSMSTPRATHLAFLLPAGRVLAAGGWTAPPNVLTPTATAEIYDPATDSWTATASMITARGALDAVIFANGRVLVAGGQEGDTPLATSEVYDPATGLWSFTGSMGNARSGTTATLLADGRVLVAGGGNTSGLLSSAELYTP